MSDEIKQALLAGVQQTYDKQRWFVPLRDSVEDLTAAQARWRAAPGRHSIWQLVRHVTHYTRLVNRMLDGEAAPENWREGEWDEGEDESAWRAEVQALIEEHDGLRRRLDSLDAPRLLAPLPGGRAPAWFRLFGNLYHIAYHVGQIRVVRAEQGT